MAKAIMIQGTMSNAGKSLLAAGLCRIFSQDGYRVMPFKAQNMALNSYITEEGLEIGRAQAVQAQAAGVSPRADMNPVLLKPTSDTGSQVIVGGVPVGVMPAREYFRYKKTLIPQIMEAYGRLEKQADIIVIEGAGSPAEINLSDGDIVNMGMAKRAGAPVLLAGDIDRGGVFAQLYGTVMLLKPEERALVRGLIINKFRGERSLLDSGVDLIERLCRIPVTGVVPYMEIDIDDEDSLSARLEKQAPPAGPGQIDLAVLRFPRLSNFTDFAVFERRPDVCVRYVSQAAQLGKPDLIVLPGTKNTMADRLWLRESGLEAAVKRLAAGGTPVWGICGGYQMMGRELMDGKGAESGRPGRLPGLDLLPVRTAFSPEKTRTRVRGSFGRVSGLFHGLSGMRLEGYEIHMGQSAPDGEAANALCRIRETQAEGRTDERGAGLCAENCYGTYVHGIFDAPGVAEEIVRTLLLQKGEPAGQKTGAQPDFAAYRELQYDRLAAVLRRHLDLKAIYRILEAGI